jgi:hypothetical protein
MVLISFFIIIIFLFFAFISQKITACCVNFLFDRIYKTSQKLKKQIAESKEKNDSSIFVEADNIATIKEKKKDLGLITKIVGITEMFIFGVLTAILLENYYSDTNNFVNLTGIFLKFLGAWVGLKTLGNYQQWGGAIFGRACFYTFIIGTFISIIFGILFGSAIFSTINFFKLPF